MGGQVTFAGTDHFAERLPPTKPLGDIKLRESIAPLARVLVGLSAEIKKPHIVRLFRFSGCFFLTVGTWAGLPVFHVY
jgi:hypothetical protein